MAKITQSERGGQTSLLSGFTSVGYPTQHLRKIECDLFSYTEFYYMSWILTYRWEKTGLFWVNGSLIKLSKISGLGHRLSFNQEDNLCSCSEREDFQLIIEEGETLPFIASL